MSLWTAPAEKCLDILTQNVSVADWFYNNDVGDGRVNLEQASRQFTEVSEMIVS